MKTKILSVFMALMIGVGTVAASDTKVGNIYYNFDDVTMTAEVTYKGSKVDSDDRYKKNITIPSKVTYKGTEYTVTSIGERAFEDCRNLTTVVLPNTITHIGYSAFCYCYALSKINISESVTTIDKHAFWACFNLLDLVVPTTVETIGEDAFRFVANLIYTGTNTDAPWGARALNGVVDGKLVYKDASKTELLACRADVQGKLNIPSTVTTIGDWALGMCASLDSLRLPSSVTTIGISAFSNCTGMVSLIVPKTVTSIGENAFRFVPNVIYEGSASGSPWAAKSINGFVEGRSVYKDKTKTELVAVSSLRSQYKLDNSVKTIGAYAFESQFSQLTSVTLGQVETIGEYAFRDCPKLTSVVLPSTVKKIGKYAFWTEKPLKSFVCEASTPPTSTLPIIYTYTGNKAAHRIYVPEGSLATYKAASVWSNYADSIFAITAANASAKAGDITILDETTDVSVSVKWPKYDNAISYTLQIKLEDVVKMNYVFNNEGELVTTAFGIPGADGERRVDHATLASSGWKYTFVGLEPNTQYTITCKVESSDGELMNATRSFKTTKPQALQNVKSQESKATKVLRDGQMYLMYKGEIYNVQGAKVE